MIKIAITEDHTLLRASFKALIDTFPNIEVVIEASNGKELLDELLTQTVDIVLLDLQMPVMNGFETCEHLKKLYPHIKILILTQFTDSVTIQKMIALGADGYFTKSGDPNELNTAINKLHENGFYFENSLITIIERISNTPDNRPSDPLDPNLITSKEMEIIHLTLQEWNRSEIAEKLGVSPKTVDTHKYNLKQKLNTKSFIGVLKYVIDNQCI